MGATNSRSAHNRSDSSTHSTTPNSSQTYDGKKEFPQKQTNRAYSEESSGSPGLKEDTSSKRGVQRKVSFTATVLIQQWYRRCCARLEARRRTSWKIFTALEYAGEQDQVKLHNFFMDILALTKMDNLTNYENSEKLSADMPNAENELYKQTDPESLHVEKGYKGPTLQFPLTQEQIEDLVTAFRNKKVLHAKYVLLLLHKARASLKCLPNVNYVSTSLAKQITICGDLHGKFDDLTIIFYKNGYPSTENPYMFNGDFVDRGPQSIEVLIILLACFLLRPASVFLNRGNHEDRMMNLSNGFARELKTKYKHHTSKLTVLLEDVFSWLPLATVIDNRIFIAHGGISNTTDISYLNSINRHKYLSILEPPKRNDVKPGENKIDIKEWKQVVDILWSDPGPRKGCCLNKSREIGACFGPDVTQKFLEENGFDLLIRSHECKFAGYEFAHDNKLLTIFSASNYYETGSNRGAYVKLTGSNLQRHFSQYMASSRHLHSSVSSSERVSTMELSAIRSLRQKLYEYKDRLTEAFTELDSHKTGVITLKEWCETVERVTGLNGLPWISLSRQLVKLKDRQSVDYTSTFEEISVVNTGALESSNTSIAESLYRHKPILEAIFRFMDRDNSGTVDMEEFEKACTLMSDHLSASLTPESIRGLAASMDFNHDGFIDLNEFLEAFRLVDKRFESPNA